MLQQQSNCKLTLQIVSPENSISDVKSNVNGSCFYYSLGAPGGGWGESLFRSVRGSLHNARYVKLRNGTELAEGNFETKGTASEQEDGER